MGSTLSSSMNRAPLERRNSVPYGVRALSPGHLSNILGTEGSVVIDVRTYTQFSESRVKGAVNVCIPSTLLKRSSFNFQRMREFVPQKASRKLQGVDNCRIVVLYDHKTSSLESCGPNSLLWTVQKVRRHLDEINPEAQVGFVVGGFMALDESIVDGSPLPEDAQPVNPLPPVVTQSVAPAPCSQTLYINEGLSRHINKFPGWIQDLFVHQKSSRNLVAINWTQLQTAESVRVHRALGEQQLIAGDITKNRYSDIAPYNHTRVLLKTTPDYINASHIQASYSRLRYIATQAPLPATFADFWQLVWDENVPMIVMLTTLRSETGQIKGDKYWNKGRYRDIELASVQETQATRGIILRTITLVRDGQERQITQIHYEDWPDVACPGSSEDFFTLMNLKRELLPHPEDPVVVHCSAGCGRTGTFCTVDSVTTYLADHPNEGNDIVNSTVAEFRSQRLAMVQVQRQFIFCYDTVIMWYYQHFIAPKVPPTPNV